MTDQQSFAKDQIITKQVRIFAINLGEIEVNYISSATEEIVRLNENEAKLHVIDTVMSE